MAAVLLFLLCAEALARWADPDYFERQPAASIDALHHYSDTYGWQLRPGAVQRVDDHLVSVNRQGFRGAEVRPRPELGQPRLVMLGDSITFGTYVGDGETFSDHLGARHGFEVANLAVQGYDLGQSLLKLEREGLPLQPRIVVLNVCLANDFADTMLPVFLYDGRHPKPYFKLQGERLVLHDRHVRRSRLRRLASGLTRHSQVLTRLAALSGPAATAPGAVERDGAWVERLRQALADPEAARALAFALIARMRRETETRGAAFAVVLHPDKGTYRESSEWTEAFYRHSATADVLIDMRREYRARGWRFRQLALDNLGHLSPLGHRIAAEILATKLQGVPVRRSAASL